MFGDSTWKTWLTVGIFALVAGFAVHRCKSTFGSRPPDWLQLFDHRSQRISGLNKPNSVWRQFSDLVERTRAAAEVKSLDYYSISVIEFERNGSDAVLWWGETVRNQGFEPLSKIERQLWMDPSGLLGFYTKEGAPLSFTTRLNPPNKGQLLVTVYLEKPIAPGATTFLVRRQRRGGLSQAGAAGERTVALGKLKDMLDAIEARGVVLPPRAALVRYSPEAEATVFPAAPTMIAWISADMKTNATPASVTFAAH